MTVFASGFSWMHLIPGVSTDQLLPVAHNYVILHAWLACFVVIIFALLARRGLEAARARQGLERYFADETLTFRTAAEVIHDAWSSLMGDVLSRSDVRAWFSLVAALFMYIFTCNIMGIFPGFLPPTDNVNTNVGIAIISFLVFNYVGLSRDPVGYIKHMAGPTIFLAPLLFPIEVVSLIVRPVALIVRLTGNMFGDHTVFSIMSDLMPFLLPVPFLMLAILVSVIQAFIFALLTTIYISLSVPHHDDEHH